MTRRAILLVTACLVAAFTVPVWGGKEARSEGALRGVMGQLLGRRSKPAKASPDQALRAAYDNLTKGGPARRTDRIPSLVRLKELDQSLVHKADKARRLVEQYDAIKSGLESSHPAGAKVLKEWTSLSLQRDALSAILADLRWDRQDSEKIKRRFSHDRGLREIADDDLRDIEHHDRNTRAKLQGVNQELAALEADPEWVRISTAIADATFQVRKELTELRQPEAEQRGLGNYSLARIQRQLGYLSERIGDKRVLLTTKLHPLRLLAKSQRTRLVTDVAHTFHHLDLPIDEASGWLLDPAAFDARVSALEEINRLTDALPNR
jgi:hypothetical protein